MGKMATFVPGKLLVLLRVTRLLGTYDDDDGVSVRAAVPWQWICT